jgi:hypothetical protein
MLKQLNQVIVASALLILAGVSYAQTSTGTLSGPPMDFGGQTVGTTGATQTETVTAAIVGSPGFRARIDTIGTSSAEFAIVGGGTCAAGTTLLADTQNCTIRLAFAPSAPGSRSGLLSVTCTLIAAVGVPIVVCNQASIALSGIGLALTQQTIPIPALGREALTALAVLIMLASMYCLRRRKN